MQIIIVNNYCDKIEKKGKYIFYITILMHMSNNNYCYIILQELQQEMEIKSQSLNSLDTSGRKLLGSLSSQEDAVMLQRRLEEMNQRWNQLKNRSVTIKYVKTIFKYE